MLILALQVIAEEVGLLQRLMKENQETEGAQDQDLQMVRLIPLTKMKKSCMESLNIESEGDPGLYLWMRSLTEGADHPQEK